MGLEAGRYDRRGRGWDPVESAGSSLFTGRRATPSASLFVGFPPCRMLSRARAVVAIAPHRGHWQAVGTDWVPTANRWRHPSGGRSTSAKGEHMYTRLLTFKEASDIDGGATYLREEVLPILASQPGYRGVTASANRSANVFGVLSIWETEQDRATSDSALGNARQGALEIVGGNLSVENLEVVAAGAVRPITAECKLLITRLGMDPAKVDEIVTFFSSDVFPVFKAQPGFCGLHNMVDRAAGKAVVGSAWESQEAIDAYLTIQPERRRIAESRGVRFEEQETRDILLTAMKQ